MGKEKEYMQLRTDRSNFGEMIAIAIGNGIDYYDNPFKRAIIDQLNTECKRLTVLINNLHVKITKEQNELLK